MFFANDLSSFFFDIRKDCLYCYHKDDQKSKAYRMVLYTLFQHIVRRLALIMVFTAEETVRKINSKKRYKTIFHIFFSFSSRYEIINKVITPITIAEFTTLKVGQ